MHDTFNPFRERVRRIGSFPAERALINEKRESFGHKFDAFRALAGGSPLRPWDDAFQKFKRSGAGRSRKSAEDKAADAAVEDRLLDVSPEAAPPADAAKKPIVRLFNPLWGGEHGVFNQKMGFSVEGELPPESSHLTRVAFTVHAVLPTGELERIASLDGHLIGGKAKADTTLWAPNYRDAQGKVPETCNYVFRAKHRDGAELQSNPLQVGGPKDIAHRVRMMGMIFDANKSFLLPQALPGIRKIIAKHQAFPQAQVLLVGHAGGDEDLAGSDIAFERAQLLAAYLKSRPNLWLNQFGPGKSPRSRWGTREIQLMLSALPAGGNPYYAGTAAGISDAETATAIKAFQAEHGLPADGKGGFPTREALVKAYMDLRGTTLGESVMPIAHGVEGHCEDAPGESGVEADERRLEAFFFEKEIGPRPAATTSSASGSAYPHWLEKLEDTDDFESHGIHVQIIDAKKQPVPFAAVILKGPVSADSKSDAHGFVSFTGLKPGEYTLASELNGYKIGVSKLRYPTAKTVPGHVKATGGK
jgi:hypothetical protein